MTYFIGNNVQLVRLFHGFTLSALSEKVGCSKQFLSRVENGGEVASHKLVTSLAEVLQVLPDFFYESDPLPITDEQCHFRKQLTTKVALRQQARAQGDMFKRFVCVLDEHLELPTYNIAEGASSTTEEIESAADNCRKKWGLGWGPVSNIIRLAESVGAVCIHLPNLANDIDALSFATRRPLIALNSVDRSACRSRFGVAHELGHLALHIGVLTGDRLTENQANRFAGSFLMPRASFAAECRAILRGSRLSWPAISSLKLRWGASKAAIIYRAHQLGVLSDEQARSGFIYLRRHGEALSEHEDHLVEQEHPEIIHDSLQLLKSEFGLSINSIANEMRVSEQLLEQFLGLNASHRQKAKLFLVKG